ncbi:hypothetical protein JN01_0292 [Entomoplasma freundtii]|uniref:Probable membrane transporter protein n=1 Tax=Entomoplasma freundtii TaxID=74700 RepID=A0A2K8NR86_9MOLU|nr:sulfite exporter TauE/SafE family protein [Entomoplasma freundtii]ATZ16294.1 hypothetical protein EFREU_v1c02680 [Entomoplasma freundtii]TDY56804.1 hypothetical protein JN01_0292 [Entomoplasma freundtii]
MNLFWLIPILILIGFFVSLLGSISGVGGGVLFIPLLLLLFPNRDFAELKFVSTLLVFTTALFNVGFAAIKRQVSWKLSLFIVCLSIPFIFLGLYLASLLNPKWTQLVVLIILVIVTFLLMFKDFIKRKPKTLNVNHWWYLKLPGGETVNLLAIGFIVFSGCFVTTLSGMGGGPLIMPLLVLLCALTFKQAAPISHLMIAIATGINLLFSYKMFGHGELNLTITLPMLVGSLGGTILAFFIKDKIKNEKIIKWLLIILIWCSIIKMLIDWISLL